ncbi:hypothetical protein SRDD_39500 [Serratia sp. DD3]|nr:hypothetical protein SRDD_39500 [Serratia sp. DD3]
MAEIRLWMKDKGYKQADAAQILHVSCQRISGVVRLKIYFIFNFLA